MSNDEEKILHTVELLKLLKSVNTEDSNSQPKENKIFTYIGIVPAIITIIGAIYFTGIQASKWTDAGDKIKSELREEFTAKLAAKQETYFKDYNQLTSEINRVVEENRNLRRDLDSLKEENRKLKEDIELNKRSINEQYRVTTWLRSQHNANIPP